MKRFEEMRKVTDFKDLLDQSVKLFGDRPLFNFKKERKNKNDALEFYHMTYNEFKEEVDALAASLIDLGYDEDERIILISKNRYEWLLTYYAVTISNKVIVPLDKALPDNEIISLSERSEGKVVIFESKYLNVYKKIRDNDLAHIKTYICMDLEDDEDGILSYKKLIKKGKKIVKNKKLSDIKINADKMSIMLFTSGTTAASKAVMLSQKNIVDNMLALANTIEFYENDSVLCLLPFHHALPTIVNQVVIYVGASLEFCDGLKYIQSNMQEYKPTILVSVPAIIEVLYRRILKTIEKQGKTKLVNIMKKITGFLKLLHIDIRKKVFKDIHEALGGNYRLVISGAAPLDPTILKDLNSFGFEALQGYGLTETSPVVSMENQINKKIGSVGKKLVNVEVRIDNKDEEGIGEIVVKGPNVMLGYYNNEKATKESLIDGEFHTGDLGYIDKDGYIFITGRKKNVIVQKNGKNIFPEEIEILIGHIPGVKECMVYGKPTQDNDLDVAVKIVYDKDVIKDIMGYIKEDEIKDMMKKHIANINDNMPPYKHIRDIIVTDEELIKNTTGKVKRFEEIEKILKSSN